MPGNHIGGVRAAATNMKKYDKEYLDKYGMTFYQYLGQKGGKKGTTGGFYKNRELARTAGALGGRRSRKGSRGQ